MFPRLIQSVILEDCCSLQIGGLKRASGIVRLRRRLSHCMAALKQSLKIAKNFSLQRRGSVRIWPSAVLTASRPSDRPWRPSLARRKMFGGSSGSRGTCSLMAKPSAAAISNCSSRPLHTSTAVQSQAAKASSSALVKKRQIWVALIARVLVKERQNARMAGLAACSHQAATSPAKVSFWAATGPQNARKAGRKAGSLKAREFSFQ
jgi:hypothetical protein